MLDFLALKKLGVVLKRAQYFILCNGRTLEGLRITPDSALRALVSDSMKKKLPMAPAVEQLSFFDELDPGSPLHQTVSREDVVQCLTGQM